MLTGIVIGILIGFGVGYAVGIRQTVKAIQKQQPVILGPEGPAHHG